MTRRASLPATALALVLAGGVTGCGTAAGTRAHPAPAGPSCVTPGAAAPTASPAPASPVPTGTAAAFPLADLTLACLDGGATVALAELRGPMVVNLWASWCQPCRAELPAMQSFAERAGGRVRVLGVASNNPGAAPAALVDDLRLTFPMLRDDSGALLRSVGRVALPVTLLVDGAGRVVYVYNATALTEAGLAALVARYLGVGLG